MKKESNMNEKNTKPVELTDEQLEQVSGGVSMFRSQTVIPSQTIPTRMSTSSNILNVESDEDNEPSRRLPSTLPKGPRPRG